MTKSRINIRFCEAILKSGAAGDITWDDEIAGFGVQRNARRTLSFLLQYRVKGNPKERRLTLGSYPTMLPEKARDRARSIKMAAQLGVDLIAEEREAREQEEAAAAARRRLDLPVSELLDAWRAAVEAEIVRKRAAGRMVNYERELLRIEASVLRPQIGQLTIGTLNAERLQALLNTVARSSVSNARNLRAVLVRFAAFANDRFTLDGLSLRLPASYDLRLRGRIRSRDHAYTLDEAAALWIAAGVMGRRGALVRWILLTACRRIEAQFVGKRGPTTTASAA